MLKLGNVFYLPIFTHYYLKVDNSCNFKYNPCRVPDASLLNGESLDWKQLSVENLSSNPVDTDWDILELDKESKMISLKFHDRLEFWRQTLNEAKTGESSKGKTEL